MASQCRFQQSFFGYTHRSHSMYIWHKPAITDKQAVQSKLHMQRMRWQMTQALRNLSLSLSRHCDHTADDVQVSNYFAPTDKAKQEGYNAYLTDKNAERLATALCRMRGAALKLGQMLSIQDEGVLPPQVRHCDFCEASAWLCPCKWSRCGDRLRVVMPLRQQQSRGQ